MSSESERTTEQEIAREIAAVLYAAGMQRADGIAPPGEPLMSCAEYVLRALTQARLSGAEEMRETIAEFFENNHSISLGAKVRSLSLVIPEETTG